MAYKHRLISLLSVLLIVLMVSWFFNHFTRVSKPVRLGQSSEVKRNSLAAAQRFLESLGYQFESIHGRDILTTLPSVNDCMIIKHFFSSLAADKEQALLDWVANGGHLVTSLDKNYDENDDTSGYHFFDTLGIQRHFNTYHSDGTSAGQASFQYYNDLESGKVEFDPDAYLTLGERETDFAIPARSISSEDDDVPAYHFVQFHYGQGYITLSSDNRFLTNSEIGKHDHAWLLALITGTHKTPEKIWLLYDLVMPSLWSLLIIHAAPLVSSIVVCLLLWTWITMQRSGPLLDTVETKRRDILEHLNMRSQIRWRYGQHQQTLAKTQQLVLKHWQQHYPFLARSSMDEQVQWISEHSGLSLSDTRHALLEPVNDNQGLVLQAQRLQQLRTGVTALDSNA